MTKARSVLLCAAAALAFASTAKAADPVLPVFPVAPPAVFDWAGFYAGVRVGGLNEVAPGNTDWLVGAELGVNAAYDLFVLGAEVALDAVFDASTYAYAEITVRGGAALAPGVLIYGTTGYGSDFSATGAGDHILAGLGAEFFVAPAVSVDGRYVYGWEQSGTAAASDIHKFTIGANFHF